jgi:hypothetical protein
MLQIKECTVNILVHDNLIPHTYVQSDAHSDRILRFNPLVIKGWLRNVPELEPISPDGYITELKTSVQKQFPDALETLKKIDSQYTVRQKKGFSLTKVKNKEFGFLYYVRYIKDGKLIHSRWTTGTNNLEQAEQFARENRERLLTNYYKQKLVEYNLYTVLETYYQDDSLYHKRDGQRGRKLGKKALSIHRNFIKKVAIPFCGKTALNGLKTLPPRLLLNYRTAYSIRKISRRP